MLHDPFYGRSSRTSHAGTLHHREVVGDCGDPRYRTDSHRRGTGCLRRSHVQGVALHRQRRRRAGGGGRCVPKPAGTRPVVGAGSRRGGLPSLPAQVARWGCRGCGLSPTPGSSRWVSHRSCARGSSSSSLSWRNRDGPTHPPARPSHGDCEKKGRQSRRLRRPRFQTAQFWQFPFVHATLTTSVTVVVLLGRPVAAPVMVSTRLPVAAVAVVATVSVELAAEAGFGLNVPVWPVPRPLTLRVTAPVNPPVRAMLTVYVVDWPWL